MRSEEITKRERAISVLLCVCNRDTSIRVLCDGLINSDFVSSGEWKM